MGTEEGVTAGLQAALIPQLLSRVGCELPEIVLLCLRSLRPVLREDPRAGLLPGGVRVMSKLLLSDTSSIRAAAAGCLHNLSRPTHGKHEVTLLGTTPLLVTLLKDRDPPARTETASALASVLITTPAKMLAVKLPAVQHLLALVQDVGEPATQMQALQALAVLAAHPEARECLRQKLVTGEDCGPMVITEVGQTMVLDSSQTFIDQKTGQVMVPETAISELDETAVASMYLMEDNQQPEAMELT